MYAVHHSVYCNMRIGKYVFIYGSRKKQLEILDFQVYIGSGFPDIVPQYINKKDKTYPTKHTLYFVHVINMQLGLLLLQDNL